MIIVILVLKISQIFGLFIEADFYGFGNSGIYFKKLNSEVMNHVPVSIYMLDEFFRLLKLDGKLILTTRFAFLLHMAPYRYCSGFFHYWYECYLG